MEKPHSPLSNLHKVTMIIQQKARAWIQVSRLRGPAPRWVAGRQGSAAENGCDPVNTSICHFRKQNGILYYTLATFPLSFLIFM